MPMRFLFAITATFEVKGAVCVEPPVPFELCEVEGLKAGDMLELRRPDGSVINRTILSLEWPFPSRGALVMTLSPQVKKDDVPAGTEIWKVKS